MKSPVSNNNTLLYGGDYNPEQWLDHPEILEADIRMMKKAKINTATMGIFSWSTLEPEEGRYDFSFLRERIDTLHKNGIQVILSTPTGARPKWMADRYEEVLRVNEEGQRAYFGFRHNHCMTSPVYREKTREIDRRLAEEFGHHPGVIGWHINNEMGGECYCPLCQQAFRDWVRDRYHSIEAVNKAWNTTFWSHTYQSFDQIEAPSGRGETFLHGLNLAWKRFVTERHLDFTRMEKEAIRSAGSTLPVTINMMYNYTGLNYQEFSEDLDYISWDNYPTWHKTRLYETALDCGMEHDRMRSIKRQPFLLMESSPTSTNWQPISKLRAPGVLALQQLQAIAHGSDGALYFQIRQSRGASEKFPGAVIDHYGGEDTRVFREVTAVGEILEEIREVSGSETEAKVAILYDTENRWAIEDAQGPRNEDMYYRETALSWYRAVKEYGLDVDLIDESQSFCYGDGKSDSYRLVIAPMLYMLRGEITTRLKNFVEAGGILFLTYWSGVVDQDDLCYLGGRPYGMRDLVGFRSEEIDGLYDGMENSGVKVKAENLSEREERILSKMKESYRIDRLAEIEKIEGADVLYTYGSDFYEGRAVLSSHRVGQGYVYGIAAALEQDFCTDLVRAVLEEEGVTSILGEGHKLPDEVTVNSRTGDDGSVYIFLQNWKDEEQELHLPADCSVILGRDDGKIDALGNLVLKKTLVGIESNHCI